MQKYHSQGLPPGGELTAMVTSCMPRLIDMGFVAPSGEPPRIDCAGRVVHFAGVATDRLKHELIDPRNEYARSNRSLVDDARLEALPLWGTTAHRIPHYNALLPIAEVVAPYAFTNLPTTAARPQPAFQHNLYGTTRHLQKRGTPHTDVPDRAMLLHLGLGELELAPSLSIDRFRRRMDPDAFSRASSKGQTVRIPVGSGDITFLSGGKLPHRGGVAANTARKSTISFFAFLPGGPF